MEHVDNTTEDLGEHEVSSHGSAVTIFAEPVHHFKNFTLTNSLISGWFAVFIIIIVAYLLRSKMKEIPNKIQNVFEVIIDGALSLCDQVTNDRELSMKIFPIAITVFFFILTNNWLGLLPLGAFGITETSAHSSTFIPFLRGGTADLNGTLSLALATVVGANIFGIFSIGLWKTINKYLNFRALGEIFKKIRKDPSIVIVSPVTFFVGIIEITGELAKIASLSFRLFGNIFAGEVLLASITAIFAYAAPIPFIFLEIMVGVVQSLIFSILLVVYFTIAVSDHDHEEEVVIISPDQKSESRAETLGLTM